MKTSKHGFDIDPINGVLFGISGRPIRKKSKGYTVVQHKQLGWLSCHRLIWESVNGDIASGMQINHKNGVKHDNRIDNLEVVTPSQNSNHAYQLGLSNASCEKNGRALLSVKDVLEIRAMNGVETRCDLAQRFNVKIRTISAILARQTWGEA